MKKLLLFLACICVSVASYAHDFEVNGICYDKISETEVAVANYNGDVTCHYYTGNLVIPESVSYESSVYKVTTIGDKAFYNCSELTSVVMPSTIKTIMSFAFFSCQGLSNIVIPNSVNHIGADAFASCRGLTSIVIPESVTTLSENLLWDCINLTSVSLPETLTNIEKQAFLYCEKLSAIHIPSTVEKIGEAAFAGCWELPSISLPLGIKTIGNDTFSACRALASCVIPEGVASIGARAFQYCKALRSVRIPSTVSEVDEDAFQLCNALEEVHISDLSSWCNINFKTKLDKDYQGVYFYNATSNPLYCAKHLYLNGNIVENLVIPEEANNIKGATFFNCSDILNLVIPANITSIGKYAFCGCSSLATITCLNKDVPLYEEGAFEGVDTNTCVLKVPFGTLEKYKAAEGWKDFLNIQEMENSGVSQIESDLDCIEVARYDVNGRAVDANYKGFVIIRYSDGSTAKAMSK